MNSKEYKGEIVCKPTDKDARREYNSLITDVIILESIISFTVTFLLVFFSLSKFVVVLKNWDFRGTRIIYVCLCVCVCVCVCVQVARNMWKSKVQDNHKLLKKFWVISVFSFNVSGLASM